MSSINLLVAAVSTTISHSHVRRGIHGFYLMRPAAVFGQSEQLAHAEQKDRAGLQDPGWQNNSGKPPALPVPIMLCSFDGFLYGSAS